MHRPLIAFLALASTMTLTSVCRADFWSNIARNAVNPIGLAHQVTRDVAPKPGVVQSPIVAPPSQTVAVVTETDRQKLLSSMQELSKQSAENADKNSSISLGLVIGAILLGVLASIAGFCKASTLAGILSILTTGVVGANNALPFRENANTYRVVSIQARALEVDASLSIAMTQEVYRGYT